MPLYFYLVNACRFHKQLRPALSRSWQQRSFAPCRDLAASLCPQARAFVQRYHATEVEPLLEQVARGLPFDRACWRCLVGEILLYTADEIPELETAPAALTCLLAPEQLGRDDLPRDHRAPIRQAHEGARDLTFGAAVYRPEHCGWNDCTDVARLAAYLAALDPRAWTAEPLQALTGLAAEEREEELAFVRDWLPALSDLYRRANSRQQIVICEVL